MLSREDRILSELIVSSGLATPEAVERGAREIEGSNSGGLVEALVADGKLDAATGRRLRDEAREIGGLLSTELPEGRTLGEFRLLREIGRGGMGIVYEAEQTSLGRRVALKVLPAGAALDERLAIRFLREARAVARLGHPGIVPIFATGHEQGVLFFAMELVAGESLAARIARGPLPSRSAAEITVEISEALHHAHTEGFVHRDVKPENVIFGADGRARLADFGLVHELHNSRLTRSHYVLGTPAYSAPEQIRGAMVDARSDVYGAGAVLYAMLSGRPPFLGEVPAAVLGRLVNEAPPPLAQVAAGTPSALIAICDRAMARDPDQRYTTAAEFADALRRYLAGHEPSVAAATIDAGVIDDLRKSRSGWRRSLGVAALVAVVAILIIGVRWLGQSKRASTPESAPVPETRFGLLAGHYRLFPTAPGIKPDIALSPDGNRLAFVSFTDSGNAQIYVQGNGEPTASRLSPDNSNQQSPAWSPDALRISYCSDGRLQIAEVASHRAASMSIPCGGVMSWSPDGQRLVYGDREWPLTRLYVVDIATQASRLISAPGTDQPSWGQNGRIACLALRDGQYDIWTIRDDGSDPRRVTDDTAREMSPVWSSVPGRLYYGSNRDETFDLWRVDLDVATGAAVSGPIEMSRGWFGYPFTLSAARTRERLAFTHDVDVPRLWTLRLDQRFAPFGAPQRLTIGPPLDAGLPQRAPDRDAWIAVVRRGDAENLYRFARGDAGAQVTSGAYRDGSPRWSPDGASIAFDSDRSGRSEIWTVRSDGTGLTRISHGSSSARFPVWSPDGKQIVYSATQNGPVIATLSAGAERTIVSSEGFDDFEPYSWSADGARIAGTARGIVVLDPRAGTFTRVAGFGEKPVWIGGNALLFTSGDNVFVSKGGEPPRAVWSAEPNRLTSGLGMDPGGREIYFASAGSKERVWVLELDTLDRK